MGFLVRTHIVLIVKLKLGNEIAEVKDSKKYDIIFQNHVTNRLKIYTHMVKGGSGVKELPEELFHRYYKNVYTYLYSLCRDAALAEDLTSEVFLEVIRSVSSFRGESDVKTWLFSIARHRWYGYLRKKKRQPQTECIEDYLDLGIRDVPRCETAEQMVDELLQGENELTRNVVRMRLEGYSYYEIGVTYGISESSARVVFFRAKSKIKKRLEKEGL